MRSFAKLSLLFVVPLLLTRCDRPARDDRLIALLLGHPILSRADYYARLYRVWPEDPGSSLYSLVEVNDATAPLVVTPGFRKLVLIHGWYRSDRETGNYPLESVLHGRINDPDNFGHLFASVEFLAMQADKHYEIYAFDYLTAAPVDENGRRLRRILDRYFADDTSLVTIFAHSMGGLVSRFGVYEGDRPAYLNRVITAGTPYHGSPWATDLYQEAAGGTLLTLPLPEIVSYFTDTSGGRDLRWDNFDGSIAGASNPKLSAINALSHRDDLFIAYQGSCDATAGDPCADGDAPNANLDPVCTLMQDISGTSYTVSNFNTSDCVVPSKSAVLQIDPGLSSLGPDNSHFSTVRDMGAVDHSDMNLGTASLRLQLYNDLP